MKTIDKYICDVCGNSETFWGGMWEPFNDDKHICDECISRKHIDILIWNPAPHLCQTLVLSSKGEEYLVYAKKYKIKTKHYRYIKKRDRDIVLHQDAICQHCGTNKKLTIDHIKPVSKGGGNHIKNYQALCGHCNSSKGNRVA